MGWISRKKLPQAICPAARSALREALLSYAKGEISSSQFDDLFWDAVDLDCRETEDSAFQAVTMEGIWLLYSDYSPNTINLNPAGFEFVRRAVAWLATDLEVCSLTGPYSPFTSLEEWEEHSAHAEGVPDKTRQFDGSSLMDQESATSRLGCSGARKCDATPSGLGQGGWNLYQGSTLSYVSQPASGFQLTICSSADADYNLDTALLRRIV